MSERDPRKMDLDVPAIDAVFDNLTAGSIDAGDITTGTLSADRIAAGSISGAKLADGTISPVKIDYLDAGDITVGTLSAARIAARSITGSKLADGTITPVKISYLDADDIITGTLSANRISGGTIDASDISGVNITGVSITGSTMIAGGGNVRLDEDGVSLVASSGGYLSESSIEWSDGSYITSINHDLILHADSEIYTTQQFEAPVIRAAALYQNGRQVLDSNHSHGTYDSGFTYYEDAQVSHWDGAYGRDTSINGVNPHQHSVPNHRHNHRHYFTVSL